jgi:hypothetical protein
MIVLINKHQIIGGFFILDIIGTIWPKALVETKGISKITNF